MNADVSRALAQFITATGLGREAARQLAEQFANTKSAGELPDWITEIDDPA